MLLSASVCKQGPDAGGTVQRRSPGLITVSRRWGILISQNVDGAVLPESLKESGGEGTIAELYIRMPWSSGRIHQRNSRRYQQEERNATSRQMSHNGFFCILHFMKSVVLHLPPSFPAWAFCLVLSSLFLEVLLLKVGNRGVQGTWHLLYRTIALDDVFTIWEALLHGKIHWRSAPQTQLNHFVPVIPKSRLVGLPIWFWGLRRERVV